MPLKVEITHADIDEATRLGLTGSEMAEKAIARALRTKELN